MTSFSKMIGYVFFGVFTVELINVLPNLASQISEVELSGEVQIMGENQHQREVACRLEFLSTLTPFQPFSRQEWQLVNRSRVPEQLKLKWTCLRRNELPMAFKVAKTFVSWTQNRPGLSLLDEQGQPARESLGAVIENQTRVQYNNRGKRIATAATLLINIPQFQGRNTLHFTSFVDLLQPLTAKNNELRIGNQNPISASALMVPTETGILTPLTTLIPPALHQSFTTTTTVASSSPQSRTAGPIVIEKSSKNTGVRYQKQATQNKNWVYSLLRKELVNFSKTWGAAKMNCRRKESSAGDSRNKLDDFTRKQIVKMSLSGVNNGTNDSFSPLNRLFQALVSSILVPLPRSVVDGPENYNLATPTRETTRRRYEINVYFNNVPAVQRSYTVSIRCCRSNFCRIAWIGSSLILLLHFSFPV